MITELNKISDIGTEFGVSLSEAKNMKYFYDNMNPYSPVKPVMENGKISDWIGYDHNVLQTMDYFYICKGTGGYCSIAFDNKYEIYNQNFLNGNFCVSNDRKNNFNWGYRYNTSQMADTNTTKDIFKSNSTLILIGGFMEPEGYDITNQYHSISCFLCNGGAKRSEISGSDYASFLGFDHVSKKLVTFQNNSWTGQKTSEPITSGGVFAYPDSSNRICFQIEFNNSGYIKCRLFSIDTSNFTIQKLSPESWYTNTLIFNNKNTGNRYINSFNSQGTDYYTTRSDFGGNGAYVNSNMLLSAIGWKDGILSEEEVKDIFLYFIKNVYVNGEWPFPLQK